MEDIRHILVAIDYSDCSAKVVRRAAGLASRLGAELTIFHSYQVPLGLPRTTPMAGSPGAPRVTAAEGLRTGAEAHMRAFEAVALDAGATARGVVAEGPVLESILGAAKTWGADMLVVGTHARRGVQRLLLGSVAEAVVRHAEVPVLTVRSHWHPECEAADCSSCTSHLQPEELALQAELDG